MGHLLPSHRTHRAAPAIMGHVLPSQPDHTAAASTSPDPGASVPMLAHRVRRHAPLRESGSGSGLQRRRVPPIDASALVSSAASRSTRPGARPARRRGPFDNERSDVRPASSSAGPRASARAGRRCVPRPSRSRASPPGRTGSAPSSPTRRSSSAVLEADRAAGPATERPDHASRPVRSGSSVDPDRVGGDGHRGSGTHRDRRGPDGRPGSRERPVSRAARGLRRPRRRAGLLVRLTGRDRLPLGRLTSGRPCWEHPRPNVVLREASPLVCGPWPPGAADGARNR
jgi:hypothetical protein